MGYYIQGPAVGKASDIISRFDAIEVTQAEALSALREGKGVVCVVSNGPFDAAGFCFDEDEYKAFTQPTDHRPKRWLVMDRSVAEKESGYKG